jgi:Arc/MetJ-type ribon-helix-helix transcriptional regulator
MNVELTSEQVQFVERAIASGQYVSAEEAIAQVWAIGMKEIEIQIVHEAELARLREIRERDLESVAKWQRINTQQWLDEKRSSEWNTDDTDVTAEQREFLDALNESRRRSNDLRNYFGDLV